MGGFEDELDAADLAAEATDDDATFWILVHDVAEVFADGVLAVGVGAGDADVCGIVEEEGDTFFLRNFNESSHVELWADRIAFEAPVAHVGDDAIWCADDDRGGAGDGVEDVDELDRDVFTDLDWFVGERIDGDVVEARDFGEFGHLLFDHVECELGAVDWGEVVEAWQEVATGADVVEVGVSEEDGFYVVNATLEVLDVGDHVVDAGVIVAGEEDTHVDEDGFVAVFDESHVFADTEFAATAEGNDANGVFRRSDGAELRCGNLLAVETVEAGFVDGDVDDVLGGADVYVVGNHALGADDFAAAGGYGKVHFALFSESFVGRFI